MNNSHRAVERFRMPGQHLWNALRYAPLFVLLASTSCAHILASKTSLEDASKYNTVEEFVASNFTDGVLTVADALPTGKPKHVLDDGSIRYSQSSCQGYMKGVEKPSSDLKTYCAAKGGQFARTEDAPSSGLAGAQGLFGTFNCSTGGKETWRATVRLEGVAPGSSSDCVQVSMLIRGETTGGRAQAKAN